MDFLDCLRHTRTVLVSFWEDYKEWKREQRRFDAAKAAMQGMISMPWHPDMGVDWRMTPEEIAEWSVRQADALLAALDRPAAQEDASE